MATLAELTEKMKQRDNLPGYDDRLALIEEKFAANDLLERPGSLKSETLAEKTDGFMLDEIEDIAADVIESGKSVSTPTIQKHARQITAKMEEKTIASDPEKAEDKKIPKQDVDEKVEPPKAPREKKTMKKAGKEPGKPLDKPTVQVLVVVDATRNMKNMENAIDDGLTTLFAALSKYDGVGIKAVLLGKKGQEIDGANAGIPLHETIRCKGRADILDEFFRISKLLQKEQRKLKKKDRPEKTIVALIADMSNVGKGGISASTARKKLQKHRKNWDVIISAYGLSKKAGVKRGIKMDEVIEFSHDDEESVKNAFKGVSALIEDIISD